MSAREPEWDGALDGIVGPDDLVRRAEEAGKPPVSRRKEDLDKDEWRGPVTEAEVPEEWEGLSPAFVMPDGTVVQSHELPPGAIYDYMQSPVEDVPEAYADRAVNGQYLVCVLPDGHHWQIDSYANNCDRGRDGHHCWIRHGEPPKLTIDKGGDTCSAGSGSIQTGTWHGFLRDGMLVVT